MSTGVIPVSKHFNVTLRQAKLPFHKLASPFARWGDDEVAVTVVVKLMIITIHSATDARMSLDMA